MKLSDVRKYINAGLTDEQIAAIEKASKGAGASGGTGAGSGSDTGAGDGTADFSAVVAAINGLKETIQASNIDKAKNREPETVDEILESLIIED